MSVAVVVVSHSARLAEGIVELAGQMAPDVPFRPVGGDDAGGLGTSFGRVSAAVEELLGAGHDVLLVTDLGSATMTAESVLEMLDAEGRAALADAPAVEGAVAAAVAAQGGADLPTVRAAAESVLGARHVPQEEAAGGLGRVLRLANDAGLHARPAALLTRTVAGYDATVTVNGADARSVIALMALGLGQGHELRVEASGPQAAEALDAVEALVASGFAAG